MSLQDGPGLAVVDTAAGTSEQVWTGTSGRLLDKANTDVVERDGTAFVSDYLGDAVRVVPSTSSTSSARWRVPSSMTRGHPHDETEPTTATAPTAATEGFTEVRDEAELRELLGGEPSAARCARSGPALHDLDRQWLAASPFCLVATSAADGTCDVSPKGDPPGFTHVLDDTHDRDPGAARQPARRRLPQHPEQPARRTDLPGARSRRHVAHQRPRAAGARRAVLRRDGRQGHRPVLALVVEIEQVFYHCAKAFLRSKLWDPESWEHRDLPTRAVIAQTLERPDGRPGGAGALLRPVLRRRASTASRRPDGRDGRYGVPARARGSARACTSPRPGAG